MKRSERLAVLSKVLSQNPNKVISLKYFAERFNAAKSSISEDLNIIKAAFDFAQEGEITTIPGAAGGVRYSVKRPSLQINKFLANLCNIIKDEKRIIPGGYIYMTDIIFSPKYSEIVGEIFAQLFVEKQPTCVLTVETKGIPLAIMTARALNVPLIVARRNSRVTEGPSVNISYVSGTDQKIQTMSLPKRALWENARVLIVDDFMRGGGTARGMSDLVAEFKAKVVGVAVLVSTAKPEKKLVKDYTSLLTLESVDLDKKTIDIYPQDRAFS